MSLILNPKFKPLYNSPKKFFLLTGGRGSAKSFHASTFATQLSYEIDHRILYSRYTMTSAKVSIIPEFQEKIELMNVLPHFDIQNNEIINQNSESEILFRGIKASSGSQTANLKSLHGITTWVYDELEEETDEERFNKISLSIRSQKRQNRIIGIMNPTTKEHWVWKRWFENSFKYIDIDGFQVPISTHPELCHIHTTYLDNINNLPKDFIDECLRLKQENPERYRHTILGGWLEKAEGAIFTNWKEGALDESLPYNYGIDFGYSIDPTAIVKVAIDDKAKKLYLDEIEYRKGLSYSQIINSLSEVHKNNLIIADCADPRMIDEIANAGYNIQPCEKGKDSVKMGIAEMQEYEIIVTERSHNIKRELNNYSWNDRKAGIPQDKHNHAIDAARYGFDRLKIKSEFYFG